MRPRPCVGQAARESSAESSTAGPSVGPVLWRSATAAVNLSAGDVLAEDRGQEARNAPWPRLIGEPEREQAPEPLALILVPDDDGGSHLGVVGQPHDLSYGHELVRGVRPTRAEGEVLVPVTPGEVTQLADSEAPLGSEEAAVDGLRR